jgi:hypothetical protein
VIRNAFQTDSGTTRKVGQFQYPPGPGPGPATTTPQLPPFGVFLEQVGLPSNWLPRTTTLPSFPSMFYPPTTTKEPQDPGPHVARGMNPFAENLEQFYAPFLPNTVSSVSRTSPRGFLSLAAGRERREIEWLQRERGRTVPCQEDRQGGLMRNIIRHERPISQRSQIPWGSEAMFESGEDDGKSQEEEGRTLNGASSRRRSGCVGIPSRLRFEMVVSSPESDGVSTGHDVDGERLESSRSSQEFVHGTGPSIDEEVLSSHYVDPSPPEPKDHN